MARQARIYQLLNLQHGTALPSSGSPLTVSSSITVREGADAVTVNLRSILNNISGYMLAAWSDLNPSIASVAVAVEYSTNSGNAWQALSTTAISGLTLSEVTLSGVSGAASDGDFTIALAEDAITTNINHDGTTRMRLNVLITDNDGSTYRVYQPITFTHGVSLPTGSHTESSATELREGALAMTFNLATILNNVNNFDLDAWDELNPAIVAVSPEMEYSTNGGSSWQVLSDSAVRGLVVDEVTFVETNALTAGTFTVAIDSNSITQNTLHDATTRMRLKVLLNDGDHNFFIYIPIDILHGMTLPTGSITRDAIVVREGAGGVNINLVAALNAFSNFNVALWSDINPAVDNITATLEYSSDGSTWQTLGAVAFRDVTNTELTADTTGAVADGMMEVELAEGSISENQDYSDSNGGFRLNILIEDDS